MKMRVAQVTATFPPYYGGTGNVCFRNARELARRGHDVHVFTAAVGDVARQETLDGVAVTRLTPLVQSGNARLLPALLRHLNGFDVIHLHYPFIGGEIAALAAWWTGTPLVITYHQDVLLKGPMRMLEIALRQTIGRAALRSAKRILFTTFDYGRASYVYSMLDGQEENVGELPNGVDATLFRPSPSRERARAELDLPREPSMVLLVAALDRAHYFKGVEVFLESIARLPDDVIAVIVGDGDMRADYEAFAQSRGIRARVRFVGRVTDSELPGYYRSADVTVLPSTTMGEAFGLVLVESMSSGTPVIATNLPGVRAVVRDGTDGLLVDPGDSAGLATALQRLLTDDSLREEMGRQGRAKIERQYDWRIVGDKLESVYQRLLDVPETRAVVPAAGED